MPYKDKEKQKASWRRWYKRNGRNQRVMREYNESYRQRNREFVSEYKIAHGCKHCGYNACAHALEFHHTGDDKESTIARMVTNAVAIKTLETEIAKCIVLCANCHREFHAGVWCSTD